MSKVTTPGEWLIKGKMAAMREDRGRLGRIDGALERFRDRVLTESLRTNGPDAPLGDIEASAIAFLEDLSGGGFPGDRMPFGRSVPSREGSPQEISDLRHALKQAGGDVDKAIATLPFRLMPMRRGCGYAGTKSI